jgi:hypothetical protein
VQPYSITSDEKRPNFREFEGPAKGIDGSASQPARSFPISVVGCCLQVVCEAAYLRTRCGPATPVPDKKNPAEAGSKFLIGTGTPARGVPSFLLLLGHVVEQRRVEGAACPMADGAGFGTVRHTHVTADDLGALLGIDLTAVGEEVTGRSCTAVTRSAGC